MDADGCQEGNCRVEVRVLDPASVMNNAWFEPDACAESPLPTALSAHVQLGVPTFVLSYIRTLDPWRFAGLEVWGFGGLEVWRFGGLVNR